jgi:hypothetical protein
VALPFVHLPNWVSTAVITAARLGKYWSWMQSFRVSFHTRSMEIGAVWWEVIKAKVRFVCLTPSAVKFGVVVFGVVRNDDHAAPAIEATALK